MQPSPVDAVGGMNSGPSALPLATSGSLGDFVTPAGSLGAIPSSQLNGGGGATSSSSYLRITHIADEAAKAQTDMEALHAKVRA